MAVQNRIVKVQKRNRALVKFDESLILGAVLRAAESIGGFQQDFLPGINDKIFEAYRSDDKIAQFLAEAVLISLSGGVAGILIGLAIPLSVRFLTDEFHIPISPISVIVAFTVSLLVGLLFGILPANRAARLNPTEALRYE